MKAESDTAVMEPESPDVIRALDSVRTIVRALRLNTREIELKIGISLAQLFVLQQVAERPAESLNDLADRTATHQSSVSVVVRRLVDRGLVSRKSSTIDKRRVQIAATAAGGNLLKGAPRTIQNPLGGGPRAPDPAGAPGSRGFFGEVPARRGSQSRAPADDGRGRRRTPAPRS